jgi:hypothetical protein
MPNIPDDHLLFVDDEPLIISYTSKSPFLDRDRMYETITVPGSDWRVHEQGVVFHDANAEVLKMVPWGKIEAVEQIRCLHREGSDASEQEGQQDTHSDA